MLMQKQEVDEQVFWPRDSLFRYFELMEMLQYNLDTRKRLQSLAGKAQRNHQEKPPRFTIALKFVFRQHY